MNRHRNPQSALTPPKDARDILGVGPNATDAEIRAAYLQKVKENPPDRAPDQFERIRDAYDLLRDLRRALRCCSESIRMLRSFRCCRPIRRRGASRGLGRGWRP